MQQYCTQQGYVEYVDLLSTDSDAGPEDLGLDLRDEEEDIAIAIEESLASRPQERYSHYCNATDSPPTLGVEGGGAHDCRGVKMKKKNVC